VAYFTITSQIRARTLIGIYTCVVNSFRFVWRPLAVLCVRVSKYEWLSGLEREMVGKEGRSRGGYGGVRVGGGGG
jgi:hypothetical protein